MKIAFVGKGGSGKTTLTASFTRFLGSKKLFTIAIDADINVGLGSTLGISPTRSQYLSHADMVFQIREYLKGDNPNIASVGHIVKTTPPGKGSRLITRDAKDFFHAFCSYESENLKFLHVGTYEPAGVGISCYHTHLSVFENILSHTYLGKDEYMITDMIAGNDAFSNTLFIQFDILCLIVEPTFESVSTVLAYQALMKKTESTTKILIIANKIEDEHDLEYLRKENIIPDFVLPYEKIIKHTRQKNEIYISEQQNIIWQEFLEKVSRIETNPNRKLKELHALHKKYMELDYIKTPLGNLASQIDNEFTFPCK